MGNSIGKIRYCFAGAGGIARGDDIAVILSDPLHEGLGHSFCYIRPDPFQLSSSNEYPPPTTTFRSISGASVSANASTPLSTSLADLYPYSTTFDRAAAFDCSTSFASIPLQPVPRNSVSANSSGFPGSGPLDRGFLSGPIERGIASGPIDRGLYSGPIDKGCEKLHKNLSNNGFGAKSKFKNRSLIRILKGAIRKTLRKRVQKPVRGNVSGKESDSYKNNENVVVEDNAGDYFEGNQSVQWAQGKAGEDRVHVVISEENSWVFVGIYDGFNGPDAPDYLLANLYSSVVKELKNLLRNDKFDSSATSSSMNSSNSNSAEGSDRDRPQMRNLNCSMWDDSESELAVIDHSEVLNALSNALKKTEDTYLEIADKLAADNPELALMGSCVLVMLMKGEDVYLMNVGDSRAVLAQQLEPNFRKRYRDFERINGAEFEKVSTLTSLQLTMDHSTYVEEEVKRIKKEHMDDDSAVMNDRVKGYLKITRAFGAGFLKQPKWNDALLEIFRIDYVGTSPYITCNPSLFHHKLGPADRFLILSSDGLYQYFTNEEVIAEVEAFIASFPEGDPAQHLAEELLFRAAKKAGMDFHELLDIPQGERRRYHDDVSVVIISLEGRVWRSLM